MSESQSTTRASLRFFSSRRSLHDGLQIVLVALVLLAARSSLADHYVIPSESMEDTLQVGDHVFVDKLAYGTRIPFTHFELSPGESPSRGEVVIFDLPENGMRLIKRVVAVGGDRVRLQDGVLAVNGRNLRDPDRPGIAVQDGHVALLDLKHGGGPDLAPVRIPDGKLLVLGDSRGNSRDGRYFGLIDADIVYGKAVSVIYRRGEGLVWKGL